MESICDRPGYKGHSCTNTSKNGSGLNMAADKAFPADGDALILLEHKYRDDGSEVVALSNTPAAGKAHFGATSGTAACGSCIAMRVTNHTAITFAAIAT